MVLDFPSERAFVLAEQGEIQVYAPQTTCQELLVGTSRASARYSTGTLPLCAFFEGDPRTRVVVDDEGDFLIIATASGADERDVLLRGCRLVRGEREVTVTLAPTREGLEALSVEATCTDAAAKCRGDCEL